MRPLASFASFLPLQDNILKYEFDDRLNPYISDAHPLLAISQSELQTRCNNKSCVLSIGMGRALIVVSTFA